MLLSGSTSLDAARHTSLLATLLTASKDLHQADTWAAAQRVLGQVAASLQAEAAHLIRAEENPMRLKQPSATWVAPKSTLPSQGLSVLEHVAWRKSEPLCTQVTDSSGEAGAVQVMLCPVVLDGRLWGQIAFLRSVSADASVPWVHETAQQVMPFAQHMAVWVGNAGPHLPEGDGLLLQKDGATGQLPEVKARQLQRRVESQRALVEASKLLVSPGDVAMEELLRIVGEATGADYAYLLSIRPDEGPVRLPQHAEESAVQPPIDLEAYAHYEWHAPGHTSEHTQDPRQWAEAAPAADSEETPTLAVPLLSSQHQLFGYLGIEFADDTAPLKDEDVRLLNVLGDMLSSYLQRHIADRALRKSERRYRHFVDTISEAIWRVDLQPPVSVQQSEDELVNALMARGVIGECNGEFATLFGIETPADLIGWPVEQLTEFTGQRILHDVVDADFQLQTQEYVIYDDDRSSRHFIVSTSGVVQDGQLISLWGSTTEVTERVRLERRMVTALEQQQQRIGRDLHDSVGQLLTGIRMLAQNLEERHFSNEAPGHRQVKNIISYAEEAAQHVGDLQRGLMPVQMERGGLAQALQELASNTDVLPDVDCIYVHDGTADIRDPERKLQLYRIAQEAINNALKHAAPSYIKVALKSTEAGLRLEVEDDGTGFDVDTVTKKSLGLHSMYYRARSVDAVLDVQSEPGQGTTVRCDIQHRDLADKAK